MPASRRTNLIIWSILGLFALGVAWVGYDYLYAMHKYFTEDQVCGDFDPVIRALADFQQDSGAPATNLTQLVPRYLPQLPTSSVADSVAYRVLPDGTNWQLSVYSRALKSPRVYVHRSSQVFTAEEERQELTGFHGWVVFKADKP